MIPAPANTPFSAIYMIENSREGGQRQREYMHRPVVAWNDEGEPLVPNHAGHLVVADSLAGLQEVRQARTNRVVGVVPGGGWMLHQIHDASNSYWEQPLVAWLVSESGDLKPAIPGYDALPIGRPGIEPPTPILRGGPAQGTYWVSHPDASEASDLGDEDSDEPA